MDSKVNKQVRLKEDTLQRLKTYKKTPRESYDEIINRLLDNPQEIDIINFEYKAGIKQKEDIPKIHVVSPSSPSPPNKLDFHF